MEKQNLDFKNTEIGLIPDDWDIKSISEIGKVASGGTPSRKIQAYWNGDIPWITTTLIDFNLIDEANEFITHCILPKVGSLERIF